MASSERFQPCTELTPLEKHYVQTYVGNLYGPLNLFLINADTLQFYNHRINKNEFARNMYYIITNMPELYVNGEIPSKEEKRIVKLIRSKSGNIEWFRHIMFHFAILLHGIILKCPSQQQKVEVYRGVLTHYLSEDINNGYFLTSFTSTSINDQIARGFSKDNNKEVIMYHFIVMPGVSCIYIGIHEDELLLNPYQRYYFVEKDDNHYYYIIRPSDIIPPHNENEFLEFKKEMLVRTVGMEGGKTENRELTRTAILSDHRNTYRSKNIIKNKNTKKNKKQRKMNELDHFRARMNLPIGSSSISFPITDDVRKEIDEYAKEIRQRIKDNKH